jgi:glutamine amidotransferase
VTIVDYGMGNIRSVANAFEALGADVAVAARPHELRASQRIVLPGVGSFGEAMARLRESGLAASLSREVLEERKPFLGICLGMQLLATRGFEYGEHRGLGWIEGDVRILEPKDATLRVPHIGWNEVRLAKGGQLFQNTRENETFYFVHSYHLLPFDPSVVAGVSEYGGAVVAAVERGNIFGTQFHPEKSHRAGLVLLKNFLASAGEC